MRMTKKQYNEPINKLEVEQLKTCYPELFSVDCEPVYEGDYVTI